MNKSRTKSYVPDRGELIWISLQPTEGHEQSGRRPALVISPKSYNRKTGLCVLCPGTRQAKGYAFEVNVADEGESASVVLSDHLRSVDWKARKAERIKRVSDNALAAVIARIQALLIEPDV